MLHQHLLLTRLLATKVESETFGARYLFDSEPFFSIASVVSLGSGAGI